MADPRVDVLSIGTLSKNRFWDEKAPVRQEMATCTLVRCDDIKLVVDPGWPPEVLQAVLYYRAGLTPQDVTHVFVTHIDPAHVVGIALFSKARWMAHQEEIVYAKAEMTEDETMAAIIKKLRKAPDKIAPGIEIFPTPGHSPGHCSLMANTAVTTTVIAGDVILTRDYLEHGDLGPTLYNREQAEESFREVIEIADLIVPGHDNILWQRSAGGFMI